MTPSTESPFYGMSEKPLFTELFIRLNLGNNRLIETANYPNRDAG